MSLSPLAAQLGPLGRGRGVAASTLLDGLVFYWTGDNLVDSVGGLTLTNNNGVTFVTGKVGNGGQFVSASSRSLSIADNATLSMGDIDFTIAAWVQLASKPATFPGAVSKYGTSPQREYFIGYRSDLDRFYFEVGHSGGSTRTVNADNLGAPSLGTWYLLIATHDSVANTISIQGNNGTADTVAHTQGTNDSTAPFQIGARSTAYWNGLVDEVGIWKRVLTAGERTTLYAGGAGVSHPFS